MNSLDLQTNGNGYGLEEIDAPPATLDIHFPSFEVAGTAYDTLHLQEPTTQQYKDAEREMASGMNVYTIRCFQVKLVANVTKLPQPVLERVPISKVIEAANFLQSFIPAGQLIGSS